MDVSLTTRELARMIKKAGIIFDKLPDEVADDLLGEASGAGHIFGATGGVMEAALRTVYEVVTGKTLEKVEFEAVRGVEAIKEAEYDLNGLKVRVAVTSGLENASKLLDMVKRGEKDYHFIEVMACPGGCVNGGGQPIVPSNFKNFHDVRAIRAAPGRALQPQGPRAAAHHLHQPRPLQVSHRRKQKAGSRKASCFSVWMGEKISAPSSRP